MSEITAVLPEVPTRRRPSRQGRPIVRLVLSRLLILPVALFAIATLIFVLIEAMPGDPVVTIAGDAATPERIQAVRADLGLDRPLTERYLDHLLGMATFDLGESYFTDQPVLDELTRRLPYTIELVTLSLALALLLGMAIGIVGAYFEGRRADGAARMVVSVVQSIPDFFLALLLIYWLFFIAGVAPPPVGRTTVGGDGASEVTGSLLIDAMISGSPGYVVEAAQTLMLPVLTLGIAYSSLFARVTRATMSEALKAPQVEFARACGLSEWRVIGYALRQARTSIVTYVAILFGALIGSAAIVEQIFAWGGVGQWGLAAVLKLDVPIISGFVLAVGLITILVYLVLDVLVVLLDPRLSHD